MFIIDYILCNVCFFFRSKETELRESLGEFSIPYVDLDFGECRRVGRRGEIYR